MKKFDEIYNYIRKNIILENKIDAKKKWGDTEEVDGYLDKFYNKTNGVSNKVSSPYNDIDYWHSKRSFNEFKEFIDNFKSVREIKKSKNTI